MKTKEIKHRNPVTWAMCEARQFRNKVQPNKKKKLAKFNLAKEFKNYDGWGTTPTIFVG